MRESFVLHAEYIEDLPEELKGAFLRYIYEYGINETEPELSGLELTVWLKIKRRNNYRQPNGHRTDAERRPNGKHHGRRKTERTPYGQCIC